MEAATALFLQHGYQDTSMDQIAARAAVSKQTVYKHFSDKEELFRAVTLGVTRRVDEFLDVIESVLRGSVEVERDLRTVARHYLAAALDPRVVQLRRLLIAESGRFPQLARAYYQEVPGRTVAALAASFQQLSERGLLRVTDPVLAANHFAFLVLAIPLDRAMFHGEHEPLPAPELARLADEGVRVFLAAYGGPALPSRPAPT